MVRPSIDTVCRHPAFQDVRSVLMSIFDLYHYVRAEEPSKFDDLLPRVDALSFAVDWSKVEIFPSFINNKQMKAWFESSPSKYICAFIRDASAHSLHAGRMHKAIFGDIDLSAVSAKHGIECSSPDEYLVYHPELAWFYPTLWRMLEEKRQQESTRANDTSATPSNDATTEVHQEDRRS